MYYTIAEGNWAVNPLKFVRTLRATYSLCEQRVKEFRGEMVSSHLTLTDSSSAHVLMTIS
jgi:hypothetical protein